MLFLERKEFEVEGIEDSPGLFKTVPGKHVSIQGQFVNPRMLLSQSPKIISEYE